MRIGWMIGGIAALGLAGTAGVLALSHRHTRAPHTAPVRQVLLAPPPEKVQTLSALLAATDRTPEDAGAWSRLGNAHLRVKAFPAAIEAYRKSIAIDPARSEVWSALGEAEIQTARSTTAAMPAPAKTAFDRALALDPGDMRARFYAIMERDFQGQHDRAIGEWLAMLRQAPMGSDADEAIRAAIAASINRNLALVKTEMSRATQVQPRLDARAPDRS